MTLLVDFLSSSSVTSGDRRRLGDGMKRFKALLVLVLTFATLAMASLASFPWDTTGPH